MPTGHLRDVRCMLLLCMLIGRESAYVTAVGLVLDIRHGCVFQAAAAIWPDLLAWRVSSAEVPWYSDT